MIWHSMSNRLAMESRLLENLESNIRAALTSKIMKLKAPKADFESDLKLHPYVRSQAYWKLTP